MESIRRTRVAEVLKSTRFGETVNVKGWVRTRRGNKKVSFIALNDGSCVAHIQIVVDLSLFDEELLKQITTGSSLSVNGLLVESPGSGQSCEIHS
jgi:asparaginyl-tRNA synthetase